MRLKKKKKVRSQQRTMAKHIFPLSLSCSWILLFKVVLLFFLLWKLVVDVVSISIPQPTLGRPFYYKHTHIYRLREP